LLKSAERGGYFYFSLVRGSRDVQSRFDPAGHDYGDPDVMPRDLVTETMIRQMAQHRATVSFDRFGRRPTYISLRFPVPAQAASSTPIDMLPGLKILAIDDQQMILDLLGGISQSLGLHLTALRDPARGVELFKKERFDIVMVDLAMGRVSGWEIAREVKLLSRDTPVIMMTGWGIDISPEEAAAGGVDFTLAKPFRIEQLTDIINRARLKYISS
jgi:CheY-like chemotaxis protein